MCSFLDMVLHTDEHTQKREFIRHIGVAERPRKTFFLEFVSIVHQYWTAVSSLKDNFQKKTPEIYQ